MNSVRRALLLSTGERYFSLVINFITVAIVSRILTPAEIGLSVIGVAIIGIAMSLREFASANFLFQQHDLKQVEVRSAFTVMLILTSLIAISLASFAPLIARSYGEIGLVPYLRVISVSLFLDLLAAPILTLLRRDMAFGKVAVINIAGAATSAGITIGLALWGFSTMSFAWAWLSSALVTGALAIALRPHFWIYRPSLVHWRRMLSFGSYNGATVLLYKIHEAVPYLLLGRFLSLDAAALYSRSLMICQLPDKVFLAGAVSVVLPAFSAEARQGRSLRQPYLNALSFITALQWPALIVLSILAYPLVDLLLGSQWHAVAGMVQIISLAMLFSFSFELNYPVMVSMGCIRDIFLRALIVCPVSAIAIATASTISLKAVAWSMIFIVPFQAFVGLQFVRRRIALSWLDIGSALWRSSVVAGTTAAGPLAVVVMAGYGFDMPLKWAFVAIATAAAGWLAGLWATRHPFCKEIYWVLGKLRGSLFAAYTANPGPKAL